VIHYVPTPFSSVVCYRENPLLNIIQFWLNYQRHFPYENDSLPYAMCSSLTILIHFYHRTIGTELERNFESYFNLLKAQIPPMIVIQLISIKHLLWTRFFWWTNKRYKKKINKNPSRCSRPVRWKEASLSIVVSKPRLNRQLWQGAEHTARKPSCQWL
jgi:hypothetical protein